MKFGVCAGIEKAPVVYAAGYDFIECTVVSLQPEESDEAVRDRLARFLESPLRVSAFNVMLPRELKVVGEQVEADRVRRYLAKALERVKRVGGETIVFGSGGARMVPEGFSRARAEEQIVQYLDWAADVAEPLGITIAIEPLNTTECNIITSVPEAAFYARQVNRRSIRVLADFYHMQKEQEPLENMVEHKDLLRHVHVSDSRRAPGMGDYPYDRFVDCIRRAGYDGPISIECQWENLEREAIAAKEFLTRVFQPA